MPTIKRIPKEKVAILHVCSEKEQLNRLRTLLVGNGNPEDGYVYKVIKMSEEVKDINSKLTGISAVVTELHEESVGKKAVVKTTRERRSEWVKVAMFIVGALSLLIIAYNTFKQPKKIEDSETNIKETIRKEIRAQEGISKITRGGYVKYNDNGLSDSVKVTK